MGKGDEKVFKIHKTCSYKDNIKEEFKILEEEGFLFRIKAKSKTTDLPVRITSFPPL